MDQAEFRQWAMIHALQGLLANTEFTKMKLTAKQVAEAAIEIADALLEANTIDDEAAPNEN